MKTQSKSSSSSLGDSLKSTFTVAVILIEIVIAFLVYYLILGDGSHFQGGDSNGHPIPGDYFAIVYKGGYLVPVLISLLLMVITFGIERSITIGMASGKG